MEQASHHGGNEQHHCFAEARFRKFAVIEGLMGMAGFAARLRFDRATAG